MVEYWGDETTLTRVIHPKERRKLTSQTSCRPAAKIILRRKRRGHNRAVKM